MNSNCEICIYGETFDTDFDDVSYDPIEIDDSDEKSEEIYDY